MDFSVARRRQQWLHFFMHFLAKRSGIPRENPKDLVGGMTRKSQTTL